jgi:hypothetical protein
MANRLEELVRLADRLARDASPVRARRLEYVRRLTVDDVNRMRPVPPLDDRLRQLADEVGDTPELARHDLSEFFRLDLVDYSASHESARRFYQTCGPLAAEAVDYLGQAFPAPEVLYLEHLCLCSWEPASLEANEGIIVEGIDYGNEDDRFHEAISGYLVSRGLAFGSVIETLAASFHGEWPAWRDFWDRYHGWGDDEEDDD